MSDLICTRCGATATYADAQIAALVSEIVLSCDGREHDWREQ